MQRKDKAQRDVILAAEVARNNSLEVGKRRWREREQCSKCDCRGEETGTKRRGWI